MDRNFSSKFPDWTFARFYHQMFVPIGTGISRDCRITEEILIFLQNAFIAEGGELHILCPGIRYKINRNWLTSKKTQKLLSLSVEWLHTSPYQSSDFIPLLISRVTSYLSLSVELNYIDPTLLLLLALVGWATLLLEFGIGKREREEGRIFWQGSGINPVCYRILSIW